MFKIAWAFIKGNPLLTIIILMALAGTVGGTLWYIDSLRDANQKLTDDLAAETKRADDNFAAVQASETAAKAKIKALETAKANERRRAESLSQTLNQIETSNETFDCPVPDFLRRAFTDELR